MKKILVTNSKGGCGKTLLAFALADALDAEIVELDLQATIAESYKLTKRHRPIDPKNAKGKYLIFDTPPYNTQRSKDLMREADIILMPCKVSMPDLIALKSIVKDLQDLRVEKKATIVFNEVRKPHNNTYKKVKGYFDHMYKGIKRADTELGNLVAFRDIMERPIHGKAKKQIISLLKELNIV